MAFRYSRKQKQIAKCTNRTDLQKAYEMSERNLERLAKTGSVNDLNCAMKQHQTFEYALLYQRSPEFKKLIDKGKVNVDS